MGGEEGTHSSWIKTWSALLRSMILLLSRILTAKGCPESMSLANFTFPKLPSPRVLPNSYFPSRIPCSSFFLPTSTITINKSPLLVFSHFAQRARTPFCQNELPKRCNQVQHNNKQSQGSFPCVVAWIRFFWVLQFLLAYYI